MNQMEIFKNPEFGTIRAVEIDGEPWLVGKDVALALGYKNPQEAIRNHVDAEDKGVSEILTPGGMQKLPIINESGLYSLVLSSKLPKTMKLLPFRSLAITGLVDRPGTYVTILASEDRSKELRQPRRSVRRQLKQEPHPAEKPEKKAPARKKQEPER